MTELAKLGSALNRMTSLSDQIDDNDERLAVRRAIGETMGITYADIMRPIVRQFPDLDPDRDHSS